MFCHKCGKQLENGAKFCNRCGAAQIEVTQLHDAPAQAEFTQLHDAPASAAEIPMFDPPVYPAEGDVYPPSGVPQHPQKKFPTIRVLLGIFFMLVMIGGSIGLMIDFNEAKPAAASAAVDSADGGQVDTAAQEDSPFTTQRIIFGAVALAGLIGATAAFIAIVYAKRTALTVCAVILYLLTSLGCIGGVGYLAVKNQIFASGSSSAASTDAEPVKTASTGNIVPACSGMALEEAQKQLEEMGCIVKTEYAYSDSVPKDHVISQNVDEGTKVKNALIIELTVSKGSEKATENATEKPSEKATEKAPEGYSQKLTVVAAKGSSDAKATLYEWVDGKWMIEAEYDAAVGSNGIGAASEGSSTTPQGLFKLGVVLSQKTVNTSLNTYHVTKNTCVVDDSDSPYYNQIMEKKDIPSGTHYDDIGEGLTDGTTYATIFIEHNGDGFSSDGVVKHAGSAIGVRGQNGTLTANYGDVDISASNMKELLSKLDASKNPMIEIKTK